MTYTTFTLSFIDINNLHKTLNYCNNKTKSFKQQLEIKLPNMRSYISNVTNKL